MNLSKAIRFCRGHKRITQDWLAKRASISQGHLSRIENEDVPGSTDEVKRIAQALQVPIVSIFFLSIENTDLLEFSDEIREAIHQAQIMIIAGIYLEGKW